MLLGAPGLNGCNKKLLGAKVDPVDKTVFS